MTVEQAQALLKQAEQLYAANNIVAAERALQQSLTLDPDSPKALDFAARKAFEKGDTVTALKHAERAVTLKGMLSHTLTLAQILKASHQLDRAAHFYQKIINFNPREIRAQFDLAEIYEHSGYKDLAKQHYRAALELDPRNPSLALRYFPQLRPSEFAEGLAILERAKPPATMSLDFKVTFYYFFSMYKEWAERVQRGALPYHVSSLDESHFHYAAAERDEYERIAEQLLIVDPENRAAHGSKASALLSKGSLLEAEVSYRKAIKENSPSVMKNIVFNPAFYEKLAGMSDDDLTVGLPPLIDVHRADFDSPNISYLSCNYAYYEMFGRTMLLSISATCKNAQIHLHIMDGSDDDWANVKSFCAKLDAKISVSAERPNAAERGQEYARSYYHAIRFIRLYQQLKSYNKTLWLMDVDALVNRDVQSLYDTMGDKDVAFRARPGRWEPWNQYNASVAAFSPTEKSQTYLRLIAAYIAHFFKDEKLGWGIDQLAMFGVYKHMEAKGNAPSVFPLNDRAVDYDYHDDGYVWCNSGKEKFMMLDQLKRGLQTSADPGQAKYYAKLKIYVDQLS